MSTIKAEVLQPILDLDGVSMKGKGDKPILMRDMIELALLAPLQNADETEVHFKFHLAQRIHQAKFAMELNEFEISVIKKALKRVALSPLAVAPILKMLEGNA